LRRELRYFEASILEISDRMAERLSLFRVVHRPVDCLFCDYDRADGLRQSLARQLCHQHGKAAIFIAQTVADGHADVVKEEFGSVLRLKA